MIEKSPIPVGIHINLQVSNTLTFLPNIDGPLEWTAVIILLIILIVLRREIKRW